VSDPFPRMLQWIDEGGRQSAFGPEMTLATASPDGVPSVRMVSLRGIEDGALRFFTHAGSRKTVELDANPRAALLFYYPALRRQLRIDGVVEALPREDAERYFATRPPRAQLAAVVSRQGRASPGIDVLRARLDALEQQLAGAAVPCPDDFVGYRLLPEAVEFWQGDSDRMHERVTHLREHGTWRTLALQP
jgi:pyridoxamine 5'-phosphate oxidase